jgi:hypothetical protein
MVVVAPVKAGRRPPEGLGLDWGNHHRMLAEALLGRGFALQG